MRGELTRDFDIRSSSVALWTGIIAPPVAWATAQELEYALTQYICANHATWIYWLITIGGVAICAAGAFAARMGGWRSADAAGEGARRHTFMAWGGIALAAFCALTIIAMAIPNFFLRACD